MTSVEAWLSCIIALIVPYRRSVNGAALARHVDVLLPTAAPVFKQLGWTSKKPINAALALMERGDTSRAGMPSRPYANALLGINRELRGDKKRRDMLKKFLYSVEVTPQQRDLANAALAMLVPDSATVAKKEAKLDKLLVHSKDNLIKVAMVPENNGSQSRHVKEIRYLVRQMTGRDDTTLNAEEKKALKLKQPKRIKQFDELHRHARLAWEQHIRGMVRENGGRPVKITDARRSLDESGIKYHPQIDTNGFERMRIGENLNLHTMDGTELGMKPAPNLTLKWNKNWHPHNDNTYVLQFRGPYHEPGRWTAVRSTKLTTTNRAGNFEDYLKAIPKLPTYRKKWLEDLRSSDKMKRTLAAMVELMYHFAPRIGTVGNDTFGFSTLRVKHAHIAKDGSVILRYIGKDSKPQRHVIKADTPEKKVCLEVLKRLISGKSGGDYLWTDPNGGHIGPGKVNNYLRSKGFPLTAEKFRNLRGTVLMRNLLAKARIAKDAPLSEIEKKVKKLAIHVGDMLGHVRTNKEGGLETTAATAIKSYIVPSVVADFFKNRGYAPPKWIPDEHRHINGG